MNGTLKDRMISRRQFTGAIAATALMSARPVLAQAKTLTYVGWSQDEAASKPTLSAMFDEYRRVNSDIRLDIIGAPWGQIQQNILLALRTGQPLDVAQIAERWLPMFASTGKVHELTDVFGKSQLDKLIDPRVLKLGDHRGKQFGLPWTAGSIGMIANTRVLKEARVSEVPKTIDAFIESLKLIKKTQPQCIPYAMTTKNPSSLSPDFQVWLWTFGGRLFDDRGRVVVNSSSAVRALTFMTDLVKGGLAGTEIDRPDSRRLFAKNQTGFYQDAPLARGFARINSGIGTKFDTFVLPMRTPVLKSGDYPQSFAWGHLLAIFKDGQTTLNSQSPQAKLLHHLALSDVNQLRYFNEQGMFPVTRSALAQLVGDPYVVGWMLASRNAERDEVSLWTASADPIMIIGEEVQSSLLGQKTPQAAIESLATRLETKMAELGKV